MPRVLLRSKVIILQEKAELLDMYCRLSFAAVVATIQEISESCVRTIVKRANYEVISAALPASMKTLHFLQNTFLSHIDNAFMWVQDCYKKECM